MADQVGTLHTVSDAAKRLRMSRSNLYRLIKLGRVPYQVMPAGIRLTDADVEEIARDLATPIRVHRPKRVA